MGGKRGRQQAIVPILYLEWLILRHFIARIGAWPEDSRRFPVVCMCIAKITVSESVMAMS